VPGAYKKVIVSWGWDSGAKAKADRAAVELWDFRDIIGAIANEVKSKTAYFGDDTLRTLFTFSRVLLMQGTMLITHQRRAPSIKGSPQPSPPMRPRRRACRGDARDAKVHRRASLLTAVCE
jgi:hypothetical protein